ncbi:MAG: hypothetical protein ACI9CU_000267, partial [Polaribacter sp.]
PAPTTMPQHTQGASTQGAFPHLLAKAGNLLAKAPNLLAKRPNVAAKRSTLQAKNTQQMAS